MASASELLLSLKVHPVRELDELRCTILAYGGDEVKRIDVRVYLSMVGESLTGQTLLKVSGDSDQAMHFLIHSCTTTNGPFLFTTIPQRLEFNHSADNSLTTSQMHLFEQVHQPSVEYNQRSTTFLFGLLLLLLSMLGSGYKLRSKRLVRRIGYETLSSAKALIGDKSTTIQTSGVPSMRCELLERHASSKRRVAEMKFRISELSKRRLSLIRRVAATMRPIPYDEEDVDEGSSDTTEEGYAEMIPRCDEPAPSTRVMKKHPSLDFSM